ncbi:DnaJ C-terminal domain-containing protein [Solirhodobacter olei]|uniref:DnaJ C-terminal domain-containing protein n=1 Tax=Solirhodobacter olei TaxID=2493082 RepID=UPI000FD8B918|nr:DnaJ C-terminal domain-containing protein [Solirhodobacter olei]
MADDPYAALGLTKSATDAEIKRAYKKIVRESHPDLNPGDARAEARFKAASAAHDLLKDPETRRRFDAGEIDATGRERPERRFYRDFSGQAGNAYQGGHPGFEPGGDPADIFADFLRQRGGFGGMGGGGGGGRGFKAKGPDARYSLEIGFLEAARGGAKRITLPGGANLEVKIPAGAYDGQMLRLRGRGGEGLGGGPAGDALITLTVKPHPHFRREGADILLTLPITIDEAVLGAKVEAPTIDGPVSLTIPKGASSGRVLRLRGRGVQGPGGEARGDQLVTLSIVAPSKPDAELTEFLEGWRKRAAENPRRGMMP